MPLAIPKVICYTVPERLSAGISLGIRVEVPLKNKLYSGIIIKLNAESSPLFKAREIISIIDDIPIASEAQIKFWQWMSRYYLCTVGEVMNVALPTGLKLTSETKLILNPAHDENLVHLEDKSYLIAEALQIQNELTIGQVQEILNQKTVYPVIKNLLSEGVLYIKEELKEKFKAKKKDFIRFLAEFKSQNPTPDEMLEQVKRSEKQSRAVLMMCHLNPDNQWIKKQLLYEKANVDSTVIAALLKKNIIEKESRAVSRINLDHVEGSLPELPALSEDQNRALGEIKTCFETKDKVLLFGVTGSGKTRVYIELIKEQLELGKQVLYLLPEIALTTQLVIRLKEVFGDAIGVYHSKMSNAERVELWKSALKGKQLFVGARSSLFLPFSQLGLIIIDEEHDPSYKQTDPAPRYQARDTCMYLSKLYGAKVLLGTATPSMESYYNALEQKYGLVKMKERFGASTLPEIEVINLQDRYKKGRMKSVFSFDLLDAIKGAIEKKEQVLIFQNRRGYAPTSQCTKCDWHAGCPNCDVSLTFHQFLDELRCHYCGYKTKAVTECPGCGNGELVKLGFGTEKIEQELNQILPDVSIARLDYDTAKTRNAFESIINDFEEGQIDILVGTQMITKGLDFDNISVVGILQADKMLFFPDFRAHERAFQLLTQVSGRAGRRAKKGRVIIQTFNPTHPVILETVDNNFLKFYNRELAERKKFFYPPFFRLIEITIKHKKEHIAAEIAMIYTQELRKKLFNRVYGPTVPGISRIRGFYVQTILIKMEKDIKLIHQVKAIVNDLKKEVKKEANVRINIDVDP